MQDLLPDDVVLADRGFDNELVTLHGAKLQISAFTRGKTQLSAKDIHTKRTIVIVHTHFEGVIGHIRLKYTILRGPLPVDYISKCDAKEVPLLDRIFPLGCALCSLSESVVPLY